MTDKKKNDARHDSIPLELHRLISELLRSAEVFEAGDDVGVEEYKKLLQVFTPKIRHALVLVKKLPESVPPEPSAH